MARSNQQDQADADAMAAAMARETERRLARIRAEEAAHNARFHGGADCDGSCEQSLPDFTEAGHRRCVAGRWPWT